MASWWDEVMIQVEHYYIVRWHEDGGEAYADSLGEAHQIADEMRERHPYLTDIEIVEVEIYERLIEGPEDQ
jgi:hypothetical protein